LLNLLDFCSLKRLLHSKASAFLSNDYYESDIAWMELVCTLYIVILRNSVHCNACGSNRKLYAIRRMICVFVCLHIYIYIYICMYVCMYLLCKFSGMSNLILGNQIEVLTF
jgi:hypothetical protein